MAKWTKGQSGNPGGRPKVVAEVRDLARQHTTEAIETLVGVMKNPKAPSHARITAATALLDRGYGKPTQHVETPGLRLSDLTDEELAIIVANP